MYVKYTASFAYIRAGIVRLHAVSRRIILDMFLKHGKDAETTHMRVNMCA
jgi:hypothetical protein